MTTPSKSSSPSQPPPQTSPAAAIVSADRFAKLAGIEMVEISPGRAKTMMHIGPQHLNGLGLVHGGAIFTLADYAFAAACNGLGVPTVALNVSISYLKAATKGALTAEAVEVSRTGRVGTYTVRVTDASGNLIALFQGLAYEKRRPTAENPR